MKSMVMLFMGSVLAGCLRTGHWPEQPPNEPPPTPAPAPTPTPLCTPLPTRAFAIAGVEVIVSARFTTLTYSAGAGAAAWGPGCPDPGSLQQFRDCLSTGCGTKPSPDELVALGDLAKRGQWQPMNLGGQRIGVGRLGEVTVVAFARDADQRRGLDDLFPGSAAMVPVAQGVPSAAAAGFGLPCGGNAAPCYPGTNPQCPPGGEVPPRSLIQEGNAENGGLPPECSCEALRAMRPLPTPCECADQCGL